MRCPKCGFNSFDHNLLCPKCRKDLTAARRLLNISIPAPGAVDFFAMAAHRAVFPEAIEPDEAVDILPEPLESIEPLPLPPAADLEDIEPVNEIEEIEPTVEEDIVPLAAAAPKAAVKEILPRAEEAPEKPLGSGGHGGGFADHLAEAQAAIMPAIDEEIEIELDEFDEPDAPAPVAPPAQANAFHADITTPPIAETALAQIKSTLAETGDLALDDDGVLDVEAEETEFEPEDLLPEGMESFILDPPPAAPDSDSIELTSIPEIVSNDALVSLDDESFMAAPESPPAAPDSDAFELTSIPEIVSNDALVSLDDDTDYDELNDMVDGMNIENIDDKMS